MLNQNIPLPVSYSGQTRRAVHVPFAADAFFESQDMSCETCPLPNEVVKIVTDRSAPISCDMLWGVPEAELPAPEVRDYFDLSYQETL